MFYSGLRLLGLGGKHQYPVFCRLNTKFFISLFFCQSAVNWVADGKKARNKITRHNSLCLYPNRSIIIYKFPRVCCPHRWNLKLFKGQLLFILHMIWTCYLLLLQSHSVKLVLSELYFKKYWMVICFKGDFRRVIFKTNRFSTWFLGTGT